MKTVSDYLTSQTIETYLGKAQQLTKLNAIWSTAMGEWAEHCFVANFENGKLVLQVKNTAWATRLRYAIPEILETLASYPEFLTLQSIRYHISYSPINKEEATISRKSCKEAKRLLETAAKNIENPILKAALMRLALNSNLLGK